MNREFAQDVLKGLSSKSKSLPSKYIYDSEGSKIFQAITELEEYYPTRCELEILGDYKGALFELLGHDAFDLIDLGSGDGQKTRILLSEFIKRPGDINYI